MLSQPLPKPLLIAALLIVLLLATTAAHPYDRATWLMEVAPVLVALPLLAFTHRRFPLTNLVYALVFVHMCILIAGGFYTYARVPLGFWLQEVFSLQRNPYDKLGHFAQGLVPALLAREILLRGGHVVSQRMAGFVSLCVAMTVSACYELIEWAAALLLGQGADEFLGAQGDVWDTQSDMFTALLGALTAWLLLARLHDRSMARLATSQGAAASA